MPPRKRHTPKEPAAEPPTPIVARESPLVFISHDTRDADLAEAFAHLLTDASGGMLRSFRSSDRKGTAGIEFGQEWYRVIMTKLAKATDVVALLTSHSVNRPWLLYEAGVATGKLDTTVLGVAIGIGLDQTQTGPFAQFQNCGDDEDSLTKLVLQLIRRNPNATPREEAVRRQVQAFREGITTLLEERGKGGEAIEHIDDAAMAKMFEEIKVLVRDLPQRVHDQLPNARRQRGLRHFPPMMLDELAHHPALRQARSPALALLVFLGFFRDELPWLYELGVDLYRALERGQKKEIVRARRAMRTAIEMVSHGPIAFFLKGPEDEEAFMVLRHVARDIDHFTRRTFSHERGSKVSADEESPDEP
jgi:TIR domain